MTRRHVGLFCLLVLLGASSTVGSGGRGEPVRVFLRDGSFIRAQALPELRDGRAWIRTYPAGLLASIRLEDLDLEATQEYQAQFVVNESDEEPARKLRGTVSGGTAPGKGPTVTITEAPPTGQVLTGWVSTEEQEDQERQVRYSERFTELSIRQESLMRQVGGLHVEQRELKGELQRYLGSRRLAGALARKLRAIDAELEARERDLEQTQKDLQALLNDAASQAIRLRRLAR